VSGDKVTFFCGNSCDNSWCWSELKALLRCLFFEVLQLSFSIPLLVKLHAFIRLVVSKLEHSVNQGSKVVGEGRDRLGRIHAPAETAIFGPEKALAGA